MANPGSQKAAVCPISFVLEDGNDGARITRTLAIRPEDLSRTEPMRSSVVQTLGGAFVDHFGQGLPTIQISGHTGWNRHTEGGPDGAERFRELHDTLLRDWLSRREQAVQRGQNPDNVRLIFADGLHRRVEVVTLLSFALRRNKSRPLLAQYSIQLTALNIPLEARSADVSGDLVARRAAMTDYGLASLADSLAKLEAFAADVGASLEQNLRRPIAEFMGAAVAVVRAVLASMNSVLRAQASVIGPLLGIAGDIARAGLQLVNGLVAAMSFPAVLKARFMAVGAAFSNTFCLLRNALRRGLEWQDYSDLYGASNCSSVGGGRPLSPLAGQNPWESLYPARNAPVTVTAPAAEALRQLAESDPVLAPLPTSSMLDAAGLAGRGVAVQAQAVAA